MNHNGARRRSVRAPRLETVGAIVACEVNLVSHRRQSIGGNVSAQFPRAAKGAIRRPEAHRSPTQRGKDQLISRHREFWQKAGIQLQLAGGECPPRAHLAAVGLPNFKSARDDLQPVSPVVTADYFLNLKPRADRKSLQHLRAGGGAVTNKPTPRNPVGGGEKNRARAQAGKMGGFGSRISSGPDLARSELR